VLNGRNGRTFFVLDFFASFFVKKKRGLSYLEGVRLKGERWLVAAKKAEITWYFATFSGINSLIC